MNYVLCYSSFLRYQMAEKLNVRTIPLMLRPEYMALSEDEMLHVI